MFRKSRGTLPKSERRIHVFDIATENMLQFFDVEPIIPSCACASAYRMDPICAVRNSKCSGSAPADATLKSRCAGQEIRATAKMKPSPRMCKSCLAAFNARADVQVTPEFQGQRAIPRARRHKTKASNIGSAALSNGYIGMKQIDCNRQPLRSGCKRRPAPPFARSGRVTNISHAAIAVAETF